MEVLMLLMLHHQALQVYFEAKLSHRAVPFHAQTEIITAAFQKLWSPEAGVEDC